MSLGGWWREARESENADEEERDPDDDPRLSHAQLWGVA